MGAFSRFLACALGSAMVFSACDLRKESATNGDASPLGAIPQLSLSAEPAVRIGGSDDRRDYFIQYTSGAVRLSDGTIVVADDGTRQIRYFDGQGLHLRTVGGLGGGPGEFQRLRTIARLSGDEIFAWDLIQQRLSLFAPGGEVLRTASVPVVEEIQTDMQRRFPTRRVSHSNVYPLQAGRLLVEPQVSVNTLLLTETQIVQDTLPLFVVDENGDSRVELGPFPGAESFFHDRMGSRLAFGETFRFAIGEGAIYVGSTRNPEIEILSEDTGEVVGSIVVPFESRALSAEDTELFRARRLQGMTSELRARMVTYVDATPWPASMPIYSDLRVASDGRVWVQRYAAPTDTSQEWMIFEPSGAPAASVTMGADMRLLDAGQDYVVTQVADDLDVQEIRVYELSPSR